MRTKGKLKDLPKNGKVATSKGLAELGFSQRKIAELMELPRASVQRYLTEEVNPEWVQFGQAIKNVYTEQDFELVQLAISHIKEKIGKARFYELTGLLKTVRDFGKQPSVSYQQQQQNIQVNVSKEKEEEKDERPADSVERITTELEELEQELSGDVEEGEVVGGKEEADIQEIS